MKKSDVKIGMKVAPTRKTVRSWGSLSLSAEWGEAKEKKLGFLYVVEWEKEEKCWVLSARSRRSNPHKTGDFFNSSDFQPYEPK